MSLISSGAEGTGIPRIQESEVEPRKWVFPLFGKRAVRGQFPRERCCWVVGSRGFAPFVSRREIKSKETDYAELLGGNRDLVGAIF